MGDTARESKNNSDVRETTASTSTSEREEPFLLDVQDYLMSPEEFHKKTGQQRPTRWVKNPGALVRNIESWILLRAEEMAAAQHKAQTAAMYALLTTATVAFVAVFLFQALPWVPHRKEPVAADYYWLRNSVIPIVNVAVGGVCLALVAPVLAMLLRACMRCRRLAATGKFFWAPKRRRITMFALARQVAQFINVFFWLLQNAYVLGKACAWFDLLPGYCALVQWSCFNFIFVLDIVFCHCLTPWLDEQGNPQTHLPGRKSIKFAPDPVLLDDSLVRPHAYKALLWLFFQANIVVFAVFLGLAGGLSPRSTNAYNRSLRASGGTLCGSQPYDCRRGPAYTVFACILVAMVIVHAVLCFHYMTAAERKLKNAGPYCQWERPYKMLRFMQATSGWITSLGVVSTAGLFFNFHSCSSLMLSWYGILPLQIATSAVASSFAYIYSPCKPRPEDVVLKARLQELAWTASEVSTIRTALAKRMPHLQQQLELEPIFCFEIAAKLLLWSDLVYVYVEQKSGSDKPTRSGWCDWNPCCPLDSADGSGQAAAVPEGPGLPELPAPQQETLATGCATGDDGKRPEEAPHQQKATRPDVRGVKSFRLVGDGTLRTEQDSGDVRVPVEEEVAGRAELGLAMQLFGLTDFEVLHEPSMQTKVLLGWSDSCLVLAFRGTASAVNAWNDLKVWRVPHPPARGRFWLQTMPLVHGGFLHSWLANGLSTRVLARVKDIVGNAAVDPKDFAIFLTGHSLGGALATLAAIDLSNALQLPRKSCYTFGAPRTGNHAFAREYTQLMPDTWHVINDRDAVPRLGKLGVLYKRPGLRVLLNRSGDLRVRPDLHQIFLHKEGVSVKEHMLAAYRASFVAVLTSQLLDSVGMDGGKAAVAAFAASKDLTALCQYLGADLKGLLSLAPEEILAKIRTPVRFELNPFSSKGCLSYMGMFVCRLAAFVFGEGAVDAAKVAVQRLYLREEIAEVQ